MATSVSKIDYLEVSINQFTDYFKNPKNVSHNPSLYSGMSPFFQAKCLYFHFCDDRYQKLKDGIIYIEKNTENKDNYIAHLLIKSSSNQEKKIKIFYTGKVVYSDMLIWFNFVSQYNAPEEDLLYIFNPLEFTGSTSGLLCGISSSDLMPCAFKCLVTLTE